MEQTRISLKPNYIGSAEKVKQFLKIANFGGSGLVSFIMIIASSFNCVDTFL